MSDENQTDAPSTTTAADVPRPTETPTIVEKTTDSPVGVERQSNGKPPAIEVRNLYRSFGSLKAVDGVSFSVEPGQVVGFVGANGAGKTTTMRIISTLDYPNRGIVKVGGIDVVQYPAKVRSKIGWMPDHFGTYTNMTVIEYLDFFARALGYSGKERSERVEDVMEFTDLTGLADRLINKLSKGMGQRLCLGRALIHDPDVLILDEPAAGLDPKARVELKHLIRVLAEDGKTVFISSHILSELGEMCDSLLFINNGRIIKHGTAESLKHSAGGTTVVNVHLAENPEKLEEWALMAPNVEFKESTKQGGRIEIDSLEPSVVATVLKRMIKDGLLVTEFHREERKLEDAFIEILGEIEASGGTTVK